MPSVTTTDQGELRKIVRRERKVELASEGLCYYDIRRWRIAEKAMNGPDYGRPKGSFNIIGTPNLDEDGIPDYGEDVSKIRIIAQRSFNIKSERRIKIRCPDNLSRTRYCMEYIQ